ncbi:hypothetical protein B0T17DRAFT_616987 [Bombardia bombarda]|uniref:AA1-like domain-containing protein n=1 Tax=Bombardia bombarda TaxID=252184 RepID=A0AA39X0B6_9PEZI|nr:hypothetical protein B0T17DRAFT_616987 [Bombardia bombarda]
MLPGIPLILVSLLSSTAAARDRKDGILNLDDKPCYEPSMGEMKWKIEHFNYSSWIPGNEMTEALNGTGSGSVVFYLNNMALDYDMLCRAESNKPLFDGGKQWYECSDENDVVPEIPGTNNTDANLKGPHQAWFRFDGGLGLLGVMQTWTCYDHEPNYPVNFNATGRVNLTLECTTQDCTDIRYENGQDIQTCTNGSINTNMTKKRQAGGGVELQFDNKYCNTKQDVIFMPETLAAAA